MLRGRERELAAIGAALESIRSTPNSGVVRISGLAGSGKSALMRASLEDARRRGWFVLDASTYLVEQQLPLVAVKRLVRSAAQQLNDELARYSLDFTIGEPAAGGDEEEAFCRLLEGLMTDYAVVLAVDDVQWLDSDSETVLSRLLQLFARRPVALLVAERGREPKHFSARSDATVPLGPLESGAVEAIVRSIAPQASDAVVEAIVARAAGHALTAAMLARSARDTQIRDPAKIPTSIRTVVAHEIEEMDAHQRDLLQTLSLMDEPFELRLLERLFPDTTSLEMSIASAVPNYLTDDGGTISFAHAAVAEAVRQTIPVDAPLRMRILAALQALPSLTLGDYERIARQANASGDRMVERDALLTLARRAIARGAWASAAGAFRRAFAISEPIDEDFARSYSTYAAALLSSDDTLGARRVLESALDFALSIRLERGFGELASMYMSVMWYGEESEEMVTTFRRYVARAVTPEDRLAMYSSLAFHYAMRKDAPAFAEARREALARPTVSGTERSLRRIHVAEALLAVRFGDYDAAETALGKAAELVDRRNPLRAPIVDFARVLVDYNRSGIEPMATYLARDPVVTDENNLTFERYLRALVAIARGEFGEASLTVERSLVRRIDRVNRRRLLSVAAAVSALCEASGPFDEIIQRELGESLTAASESSLVLAAWQAAAIARTDPDESRRLARIVTARLHASFQPTSMFVPLPLALQAHRASDEEMLEFAAAGVSLEDGTRWHRAQKALARGIAMASLGRPDALAELDFAEAENAELGAPYFASLAARYAGRAPKSEPFDISPAFSAREHQVRAYLDEGRDANEIAAALGLSPRTIEHSIAAIRTQHTVDLV